MNTTHPQSSKTLSHRMYGALVWLYPTPFRNAHGCEMKQVFRSQLQDTEQRSGTSGLLRLWVHVLVDFVWTCPKEHVLALPGVPRRMWEHLLRVPVWRYPALLAVLTLVLSAAISMLLLNSYSSTATFMIRSVNEAEPLEQGGMIVQTAEEFDPHFFQLQFELLNSKATLYPVIERLALEGALRDRRGTSAPLATEDIYRWLKAKIQLSHIKNTELVDLTVYDEDPELAKRIANEIVLSYRAWSVRSDQLRSSAGEASRLSRQVIIINPPEVGLRPVRPNVYLNIALGTFGGGVFGVTLLIGLLVAKSKRSKLPQTS